jgi:hypothetical protein
MHAVRILQAVGKYYRLLEILQVVVLFTGCWIFYRLSDDQQEIIGWYVVKLANN